jgi:hypothetical protein
MKRFLTMMACALLVAGAGAAGNPADDGPLLAFCAPSAATARPGDAVTIDCVLSNISPASIVLSSEGRWLGLFWAGGGASGRTAAHFLFRRSITASYLTLRPGDAVRQTQTFWVPGQQKPGPVEIRTQFRSLDDGQHFDYQAWTGTVSTAAIRITIRNEE